MAAKYGKNFTDAHVNEPVKPYEQGELAGRVRMLYDEYDLSAVLALNDTIDIGYLPKGARIVGAWIAIPASLGTGGILDLGWAANGVESADADGLIDGADAGGQAVFKAMSSEPGALVKFSAETLIQLKCDEASSLSAGKIKAAVLYVMD